MSRQGWVREEAGAGRRRRKVRGSKGEEEQGPEKNEKDPFVRWKDRFAKQRKEGRVAAKLRGWERKKPGGNPRV